MLPNAAVITAVLLNRQALRDSCLLGKLLYLADQVPVQIFCRVGPESSSSSSTRTEASASRDAWARHEKVRAAT